MNNRAILAVDDVPEILTAVKRSLERAGFARVRIALEPKDASK
jgi:hypothetical protein